MFSIILNKTIFLVHRLDKLDLEGSNYVFQVLKFLQPFFSKRTTTTSLEIASTSASFTSNRFSSAVTSFLQVASSSLLRFV